MFCGLFGKSSAQPGKREELVQYLLRAAKLLHADPRCIHYVVSTSDDPDAVWVSEVWSDRDAHDAALQPEDTRALIQHARPLIAGVGDRTELAVLGGEGLGGAA